jgi:molecular chaperone DnaK
MGRAIGIDLGTTNSVVAVKEDGQPTVIINQEGNRTTASVVGFTRSGEPLVGALARRQAVLRPGDTVCAPQRFIGRRYAEVESELRSLPSPVVSGPRESIRFAVAGGLYAPEQVSALVLRRLAEDAARYLGENVTGAVIAVPAYFDDAQRQATREAGALAGLSVLGLIDEPAAAALAYGLGRRSGETVLVFDLGGGTFDVSLLEAEGGGFEVRSTAGDRHLGGDDFDRRIVGWMADGFEREQGIDLRRDRQALARLFEAAEAAKIELSTRTFTSLRVPFVTADGAGPKHLEMELTRTKLDELTADLVEGCVWPFRKALAEARLSGRDIDEVVLAGGSTRIPAVQSLVRRITGRKRPHESQNPDEVVARGAAIQAALLSFPGNERSVTIPIRVAPLSSANDNELALPPNLGPPGSEPRPDVVDALYSRK